MTHNLVLSILLLVSVNLFAQVETEEFQHDIPFKMSGHILVDAEINGVKGLFLVDNGCFGGILFTQGVKAIGLSEEVHKEDKIYPKSYHSCTVNLNNLDFDLTFRCSYSFEKYMMNGAYKNLPMLGILGTNILNQYTVTIDYINQKITLDSSRYENRANLRIDSFQYHELDIQFKEHSLQTFIKNGKINGLKGWIHYDTGIPGIEYKFDQKLAKKAKIKGKAIPKIEVGDLVWENWDWQWRDFRRVHGDTLIGEIGNLMLSNCIVTVYPIDKKMVVQRDTSNPNGYKLGVIFQNGLEIKKFNSISLLEQMGGKKGDVIIEIDGRPCTNKYDIQIILAYHKKNKPLEVLIDRNGERLKLVKS